MMTYFKIAWRNLLKNKWHTAINTGGLVIGFTIGLGVLLVVYSQYRYAAFHNNGNQIYEVYQSIINKEKGEEVTNAMSYAAGPAYELNAASIEKTTRITDGGNHVQYKGKELLIPVLMADKDFFTMFSFEIISGNHQNPLQNLSDAVVTDETAKKIFGDTDPIGKNIQASAGDQLKLIQ